MRSSINILVPIITRHGVRSFKLNDGQLQCFVECPGSIPFDIPDQWPKGKRCFQQYRIASGLSRESEECQVNTLLYCLSEDTEDILASTNIAEELKTERNMTVFWRSSTISLV